MNRRLAGAVLVAALATSAAGVAPAAAGCTPQLVPGLGPACPVPGGWRVLLDDGTWVLTHGGDAASTLLELEPAAVATPPACVEASSAQGRGVAIYARPIDRPDLYATMVPRIRTMIAEANGALEAEAALFDRTLRYRMACEGGSIAVADVVLPTPLMNTTFDTVLSNLKAQGYASPIAKYWIWFDGRPPGAPGGTGTIQYDNSPNAPNQNNFGPSYGVTWGYESSGIMMHENGHNLGAVQLFALNSTGAGHCNDGRDVMCYNDGGPRANYKPSVCSVVRFDCGNDDYFNPAVTDPEHLLANRWNLGSPVNRFVTGCLFEESLLNPAAPSSEHEIPAECRGRLFAAMSFAPLPPVSPLPFGAQLPNTLGVTDVDVCWYAGAEVIRCDGGRGSQRGTVPADATRAVLTLAVGAAVDAVLAIV